MNKEFKCIQDFKAKNPDFNWENYTVFGGQEVPYYLKNYQCLFQLIGDHTICEILFSTGFYSPTEIASRPMERFIEFLTPAFNKQLPEVEEAGFSRRQLLEAIYDEAVGYESKNMSRMVMAS